MKRLLIPVLVLFALGMVLGGIQLLLRPASEQAGFLPTAVNDLDFAVIGLPSSSSQPSVSISAHTAKDSYPIGTAEIDLVITNHSDSALLYTGYYDFRRAEGGEWLPLNTRTDVVFDQSELILAAGETATQSVPIDLFDSPLGEGVYRAAQLACFQDTNGQALACTEISAEFKIT